LELGSTNEMQADQSDERLQETKPGGRMLEKCSRRRKRCVRLAGRDREEKTRDRPGRTEKLIRRGGT